MERPADWPQWVHADELEQQIVAVRKSIIKGNRKEVSRGWSRWVCGEFRCNSASTRAAKEGAGAQWFLTPFSAHTEIHSRGARHEQPTLAVTAS
jgi:hypothetical protein